MPTCADDLTDERLLAQAWELCRGAGGELLYLCRFGAQLYGLTRPDASSDTDLCGLYLPGSASEEAGREASPPGKASVLLYSTSCDRRRNAPGDLDIELLPWTGFAARLQRCEVKALDLAFSPSHPACVLYKDKRVDALFDDPSKHLHATDVRALSAYSHEQTDRYGVPGSRRLVLWRLHQALPQLRAGLPPRAKLSAALDAVLAITSDLKHCRVEEAGEGESVLQVAGKLHPLNVRLSEFAKRIEHEIRPCLPRLLGARQGTDIDWKAVSHALRAVWQHQELVRSGRIRFPYEDELRQRIMAVKLGQRSFDEASELLTDAWRELDELLGPPQA